MCSRIKISELYDICWTFCTILSDWLFISIKIQFDRFCSLNFGLILSNFLLFESLISKDHYMIRITQG